MKDRRIRYDGSSPFFRTLTQRVDEHFARTGAEPRDAAPMYRKSAVLLGWWLASYLLFVLSGGGWILLLATAVSMGFAIAGLGMAVQHDGGHGAFSRRKWVNAASARVLDLIGGSSYLWRIKHNVMHHTYPNVDGSDDDIDLGALARLAPTARRRWFHRWQHLYMWGLYGMLTIKWQLYDDFDRLARGHLGSHPIPPLKRRERQVFWLGKAAFFTWALAVPLAVHGVAAALTFYVVSQFVAGLTLSTTFQLAHCVEEADYFEASDDGTPVPLDYAAHQLATTVDFATRSPAVTWYTGGLNHQAIHHLFPRICHVHYPELAGILRSVCAEQGVPYRTNPSVGVAVRSHYRWLRRLGRADEVPAGDGPPGAAADGAAPTAPGATL